MIVTGAASGIGRAAALSIASQGGRVTAMDVDDASGAELSNHAERMNLDLSYVHADVSSEPEVRDAVARTAAAFGGVDVLIHAAGVMAGQLTDLRELNEETWDRVIDINLKGAFFMTKHVADVMVPTRAGVLILVASKAGVVIGSGSYSYGASKGGVHGLALTLDRHLGPLGIRVNDVCPEDVDTPLLRGSLAEAVAHGADRHAVRLRLERLSSPETVAEILAFLASDAASGVRGTVFTC
ncbi:MAG: SDR family oxidoreductase [Candidatus Dormibacter sp.]